MMKRSAAARFAPAAVLSFRIASCSVMALVTHPPVPQKFAAEPVVAPNGISMKCHGAVAGSLVRSSSAQVAASTIGSSPVSPQNRFNCGSIGFAVSSVSKACFASGVRCFSASAATVSCPRQPQARPAGAHAKYATATTHTYARLRFIGILLALPFSARERQNVSIPGVAEPCALPVRLNLDVEDPRKTDNEEFPHALSHRPIGRQDSV